jgi:hypothetical protein
MFFQRAFVNTDVDRERIRPVRKLYLELKPPAPGP